jgi:hypothetical protein
MDYEYVYNVNRTQENFFILNLAVFLSILQTRYL